MDFAVVRALLTIALRRGLIVWNVDVKTAFLNSPLDEQIFIRAPAGFRSKAGHVIRLLRSLYGPKQSGHNWSKFIGQILVSISFRKHPRVPTVFVHREDPDLMICVYVDDCFLLVPTLQAKDTIVELLGRHVELHDRGPLKSMLGIEFQHTDNEFIYNQRHLIEELLDRFEIKPNAKVLTPLSGHELIGPMLNAADCDRPLYGSIVGSLLYIARFSRPDILLPVIQMSQFREQPKVTHLRRLYRIMIYLRNTVDRSMRLVSGESLRVYTDSSFNSNFDSKNFSGTFVLLGESIIHWSCNKMRFVVVSSDEAEIVGSLNALKQLLFFRYFNCELLHPPLPPPVPSLDLDGDSRCSRCVAGQLLIDNQGTISFCQNSFSKRTNYLNCKFNYLFDQYQLGSYSPAFVASADNRADILTKNLTLSLFDHHVNHLFV